MSSAREEAWPSRYCLWGYAAHFTTFVCLTVDLDLVHSEHKGAACSGKSAQFVSNKSSAGLERAGSPDVTLPHTLR